MKKMFKLVKKKGKKKKVNTKREKTSKISYGQTNAGQTRGNWVFYASWWKASFLTEEHIFLQLYQHKIWLK